MLLEKLFATSAAVVVAVPLVIGGPAQAATMIAANSTFTINSELDANLFTFDFNRPFTEVAPTGTFATLGLSTPANIRDLYAPGSSNGVPTVFPVANFVTVSSNVGTISFQLNSFTTISNIPAFLVANPFSPSVLSASGDNTLASAAGIGVLTSEGIDYLAQVSFVSTFTGKTVDEVTTEFLNTFGTRQLIANGVTVQVRVVDRVPEPSPLPGLLSLGMLCVGIAVVRRRQQIVGTPD